MWKQDETLEQIVLECKKYTEEGTVASYIPALAKADVSTLGIAIYRGGDEQVIAGDADEKFTLQSISKVIALALALLDVGEEAVFSKVGMEPTGDPFNSISKLETSVPSKPLNPMINAGALAVTNMIIGETTEQSLGRLLSFIHELTKNPTITYNLEVAQSEFDTAFLNRSLSYFLKQHGVIQADVEQLLDLYTKQCAIEMCCSDLARIGYVFANEGRDPDTGQRIVPLHVARIIKTFMVTCGMYNASGEFAIRVGIPAKSGVSGAILALVPNKYGIAVYSPALDEKGNSLAGIKLLETLSCREEWSIF
ncbi:glutaminase A [Halalkalibacterium halodurans]|uniref:Glutaminase 1 n=1 Tax=Halalkalibacterium halodurans (strain ATCC BAA-125 / DSM 18197 / FERM 7344 / JCM 9153 / C-125) TaxID=272558 RepID=GLSA1_HALH5|nr:glutaminase A [Halalkalibacterium halodurans]Q9K9L8.1 RecName: Full=Glutaminase 1 [Halalkalibacterium halodurans C-125]MDY7223161.1 glutaminase A [Halalkalibacterium halodurans]MDY7242382.1 glutaminase A [Halalkalibacterium halodurans]MED3647732.1 glutaminase A [Halalkalibacterium halodurans]MED4079769.1 glutaminase A [Halalkalibacterium halodurans]MED4086289.1 glutaminase A [Halalkalibacterium halodurans]